MPKKETAQPERMKAESGTFIKKVGGTTYRVNVHFSKTSKETLTDKMLRLIKREVSSL
jgi:hypothetical protein